MLADYEFYQAPEPSYQDPQSNSEAKQVLAMADSMLATMDPTTPKYQAVLNAADYLRMLLGSGNADPSAVMSAVQTLTMAMGGVY